MISLKLVPDADMNAEGEWVTVDAIVPAGAKWAVMANLVKSFIPAGYHVVGVSRPGRDPDKPFGGALNSTEAGS